MRIASRQIHLDFHTSEKIMNVCSEFDAEEFASTLEKAHVNSVTLFSCCHHGMLYYDSKLFPEMVHPNLVHRDLLREQAEACHRHGIHVNLYTTIRWNKPLADNHPEWVCIDENGALQDYKGKKFFEAGFYKNLCVNTSYRNHLKKQFGEVMESIPAEGVWFDAAFTNECCCHTCTELMKEKGLDPTKKEDRQFFARSTYYDMIEDLTNFAKRFNPEYNICFNKGHVGFLDKPVLDDYSYFSFESLPGADWGYMDFPISAKYMRNFGKECLGLTSRFHTEWGDFHAYRNKAAMEFEVFSMLANGCKCTIGDQMDYWGMLNPYMYQQIGEIYESVEEKEPWCLGALPVSEIGVFTTEEFFATGVAGEINGALEGVSRLLLELSHQFDIIDSSFALDQYKLLILPDVIPVNENFANKLSQYIKNGGKVIASYHSGLNEEGTQFSLKELCVSYKGDAPHAPDFIRPIGHLGTDLADSEHVMYSRGTLIDAAKEAEFVQMAVAPVFDRSYEHFCSHLHSPSSRKECYPAIVETSQTAYFIHPIFTQYQVNTPGWYKKLFRNELNRLLEKPIVQHNGPSSVVTNLLEQSEYNRQILHILHYVPQRKCSLMDIVDDIIPLYNLKIVMQVRKKVKAVYTAPKIGNIEFTVEDGTLTFSIPEIKGHQMCIIDLQ